MKYVIKNSILIFAFLVPFVITPQSFAASKVVIFYLDENYRPIVKLERLGPMSEGMRAILAMYALQNGAGCTGHTAGKENLDCLLTEAISVGWQCSAGHITLVRKWFKKGIPQMSGYAESIYKNIGNTGNLEGICYGMPEGASFQRVWDIIRITQSKKHVTVDAHGGWMAREETGSFRYITEFKIDKDSVVVISHKEIPVGKKK